MALQVYSKHFLLCETVPLFPGPHPGVRRFRRREPGLRQLGTVACQGKALAVEGHTNRGVNTNHRMTSHLCDPTRLRAETRRTQGLPVPRGGFHKAGEGPAFGDSFPDFSSLRNRAQRSVPQAGKPETRPFRRTSLPNGRQLPFFERGNHAHQPRIDWVKISHPEVLTHETCPFAGRSRPLL